MTTLQSFLSSCDAREPSKAAIDWNSQLNLQAASRSPAGLQQTAHIQQLDASDNPVVRIGYRGNEAVVRATGRHLWTEVLFVDGNAEEVRIGNGWVSGTSTYRADPALLVKLAEVARSIAPDKYTGKDRDYPGEAVIILANVYNSTGQRFGMNFIQSARLHDVKVRDGELNAIKSIHVRLSEMGLATTPYDMTPEGRNVGAGRARKFERA